MARLTSHLRESNWNASTVLLYQLISVNVDGTECRVAHYLLQSIMPIILNVVPPIKLIDNVTVLPFSALFSFNSYSSAYDSL